ncbi:MAG: ABC-F family ATP-binding cassette domain-containing protein [Terricaulis sp.]
MSALITLDAVSYRTPDGRLLLDNLTLAFGRERTGVVGRNGAGKTTLARLVLGEVHPASGAVSVNARVAAVRQLFAPAPGTRVADVLGVRAEMTRLARIEAGNAQGDDLERADWDLPGRASEALARVGLAGLALEHDAQALSGGEATRVALAGALAAQPDFIVLDEPTNNLDTDGRAAVHALLETWRGGALVISHDRAVLRGMDRILELSELGARLYGGGYDSYMERREGERAAAARALDQAERNVAAIARDIQIARERKQRRDAAGKASRAKGDMPKIVMGTRAEHAENSSARGNVLAERMRAEAQSALEEARAEVERTQKLAFDLPSSGLPAGKTVLTFDDVSFAWPGQTALVSQFSFEMRGSERVALIGGNGSGKSTLIALARGAVRPTQGAVRRGVSAAVLDQQASLLHADETLLANFLRLNPHANENAAFSALAKFLFRNQAALKRADELSGGEKLRAALACTLFGDHPPQLLILDEPTNHLDLQSVEAIESALAEYDGALLVASHDADFLDALGIERPIEPADWAAPEATC